MLLIYFSLIFNKKYIKLNKIKKLLDKYSNIT